MELDELKTLTQLTQLVLLDCKWLVNQIVKEDVARPAIDKITQDINKILTFVQVYSVETAPQYTTLPTIKFYHETVVQTAQRYSGVVMRKVRMFVIVVELLLHCGFGCNSVHVGLAPLHISLLHMPQRNTHMPLVEWSFCVQL